ncbi:hypothetical protein BT63DRAFT_331453 [Microthyrium microscopicum]|uniref:Pentatricopeptide repeat-containing protein-mitochondrial domain-containing protein n=1 Tax=Microthyrium microscopicum TaxID=703497 RepID=A0A6A6U4V8_9PEZI|nr:hypothetical protein BT63DRAFT_331453 [Microthyrium microscopicum]
MRHVAVTTRSLRRAVKTLKANALPQVQTCRPQFLECLTNGCCYRAISSNRIQPLVRDPRYNLQSGITTQSLCSGFHHQSSSRKNPRLPNINKNPTENHTTPRSGSAPTTLEDSAVGDEFGADIISQLDDDSSSGKFPRKDVNEHSPSSNLNDRAKNTTNLKIDNAPTSSVGDRLGDDPISGIIPDFDGSSHTTSSIHASKTTSLDLHGMFWENESELAIPRQYARDHGHRGQSLFPQKPDEKSLEVRSVPEFSDGEIQAATITALNDSLLELGTRSLLRETNDLVQRVIRIRGEKPNYNMFLALTLANAAPEGSVDGLLRIVSEMASEKLELDQPMCHAILRALAVHPDHILRTEILQHMERRWFGLSEFGYSMVVAGMFRELQLERAVEELQSMKVNNIDIPSWLYGLAITTLVEGGEMDEAMRVMRLRLEDLGPEGLSALWTYMLDSAAEKHHYIPSRYIWLRCVKPEYMTVSAGTSLQLLSIAARNGDVEWTNDILRVAKRYHGGLNRLHWESLVETYANAQDYEQALTTLVEMHRAGITPDHSTTRPIYLALQANRYTNENIIRKLFEHIKTKHSFIGDSVPIAAVNVLIECSDPDYIAYEIYDDIRIACREGPNLTTFHHLFAITIEKGNIRQAMKFASEHQIMGLQPDAVIYDGLIRTLLRGGHDLEQILHFYDEMRTTIRKPMMKTLEELWLEMRHQKHARQDEVMALYVEVSGHPRHKWNLRNRAKQDDTFARLPGRPVPTPYPPEKASVMAEHIDRLRMTLIEENRSAKSS